MAWFVFGFILAGFVFAAYKINMLTLSGGLASWGLGMVVYGAFGFKGLGLLLLFFITSSLLSKWGKVKKLQMRTIVKESKGRDSGQVLANGGGAFFAGAGYLLFPHPFWLLLLIGSLAEAAADTWASEVGVLSRAEPYHILRRRRVERGISGAVSSLGLTAAAVGSFLISAAGSLMFFNGTQSLIVFSLAGLAGFLGNMLDTVIGGTVQVSYRCKRCGAEVEERFHCGVECDKLKGWSVITNNAVNFASSTAAGLTAGVLILWI
ncbi:DUF92 domain-containing protein [Fictibacillus sp. NRS-1165]|uniref:DUF92 domain-containing protein n=1 Tax=Fictibacillus sp. NRS-1165 TaxID=3144463 RepID=UPI003D1A1933